MTLCLYYCISTFMESLKSMLNFTVSSFVWVFYISEHYLYDQENTMKDRNIQKCLLTIYKGAGLDYSTSPENKNLFKWSKEILQENFPDLKGLSVTDWKRSPKASTPNKQTNQQKMQIFVITFQSSKNKEKILKSFQREKRKNRSQTKP